MKKIMIFLMALIPVMLIMIIQLTTIYIEDTQYVAVESVAFQEDYKVITKSTEDNVELAFPANVLPLGATNKEILYSSSDETIAIVSQDGVITFKDFGVVVITAQSKATAVLKDQCTFLVTDSKIHKLEITNKIDTLIKGQIHYLECTFKPIEALNKNLIYTSFDNSVATVAPNGKITAVDGGTTTITVSTDTGIVDSFNLNVFVPVSQIEINESEQNCITGKTTVQFPEVKIYPHNATNKKIIYTSESEEIAAISQLGEITFKKAGECIFTATSEDGGFTVDFKATYTGGYILSAEIDPSFDRTINMNYEYGKTISIPVNIYPADADVQNIYYTSSNENVIKIIENQATVIGGGSATISVYAKESSDKSYLVGTIVVNVNRPAESIQFLNTENGEISIEEANCQLSWLVLTADHTDKIVFESSNSALATVSESGYVSFASPGYVDITIRANQNVYDVVKVTFSPVEKVVEIAGTEQSVEAKYLDNFALIFTDSEVGAVDYVIDDPSILAYDEQSQAFTALKGGQTKVTATSNNKTIIINVIVLRKASKIDYEVTGFVISDNQIVTSKKTLQIVADVLPDDATNKTVSFSVDDETVATIKDNGQLTFIKAGTVVVSMKVDDLHETITIVSSFGLPSQVELSCTEYVLEDIGETVALSEDIFEFAPEDYVFNLEDIEFSSQDSNIATVDSNGNIVAVGKGTTQIYIKINGIRKTVNVEVKVKTKEVKFAYKGRGLSKGAVKVIGATFDLDAVVYPQNANNKAVTYEIVSGSATVDQTGVVSFTEETTTVIVRVTTNDTGISKDLTIDKISGPEYIEVYLGESNVSGKLNKVAPTDPNPILSLKIVAEDLLDSDTISLSNVVTSSSCEEGLGVDIEYNNGYFIIKPKYYRNKSMTATCSFVYGTTSVSTSFKFYVITGIDLALKAEGDLRGLQQKRVFGSYSYINGALTATLPIDYSLTSQLPTDLLTDPTETCQDQLHWHSSNTNIATIENNVLIFNNANITEETTLTISVGNELEESTVTASYTYTIVSGVNVFDADGYNYCVNNGKNLVLHAHLGTSQEESLAKQKGERYSSLTPTTSDMSGKIYGNGYVVNYHNLDASKTQFVCYGNVYNFIFKGQDDSTDKSGFKKILCLWGEVSLEYSIIQNLQRGISMSDTKTIRIKNSIIRYTAQYGMLMCKEASRDVYLENVVFHDVGQCAVNYQNGNIYVKGFLDIYNFSSYTEYDSSYQTAFKNALQSDEFAPYVDKSGGTVEKYLINVGIASFKQIDPRYPTLQETVHFYDPSTGNYVANVDKCTGLGYQKLVGQTGSWIKIKTVVAWTPPTSCSIKVGMVPDETKVYRQI